MNQAFPMQHFPSCVCFTHTMSLTQDYVILNMKMESKSHDKTNTSTLMFRTGRRKCDKMNRSLNSSQRTVYS